MPLTKCCKVDSDLFLQNGMNLAHNLVYGLEQSTKNLNKKAQELINMQASMHGAYSGNTSVASLSYFDQDQARVRRYSVVSEEEILNEVDKLEIDNQNIKRPNRPVLAISQAKNNFGVVSIKNLHESEKRNIEKHVGRERRKKPRPNESSGNTRKDYISMKLSPDLNYMNLKPVG